MFPSVLKPLLRAASAHGVTALRNPFEPPDAITFQQARNDKKLLIRKAETTLLRSMLHRCWLKIVRQAGFATTDGSLGVTATGSLDEASLHTMLRQMPHGTWELVCHPGHNDRDLAAIRTKLRQSREVEMAALLGITAAELRGTYGAELVSFRNESPRSAAAAND
jgi:hypothetical protein